MLFVLKIEIGNPNPLYMFIIVGISLFII